ncbi:MAG: hypothetical protein ACI9UV_003305, partial [Algoriphagus sp.]
DKREDIRDLRKEIKAKYQDLELSKF